MSEMITSGVTLAVDMRKNRIRVHRCTLHKLGDPKFIQLLVHPEKKVVAIRALDHDLPGDQAHKVSRATMLSDNSFEIYSRTFITKLCEVAGGLKSGCYRMEGAVDPGHTLALFHMDTLKPVE